MSSPCRPVLMTVAVSTTRGRLRRSGLGFTSAPVAIHRSGALGHIEHPCHVGHRRSTAPRGSRRLRASRRLSRGRKRQHVTAVEPSIQRSGPRSDPSRRAGRCRAGADGRVGQVAAGTADGVGGVVQFGQRIVGPRLFADPVDVDGEQPAAWSTSSGRAASCRSSMTILAQPDTSACTVPRVSRRSATSRSHAGRLPGLRAGPPLPLLPGINSSSRVAIAPRCRRVPGSRPWHRAHSIPWVVSGGSSSCRPMQVSRS